ncbi:MAG: polysaccharide deacetylase family protein [Treponema sp.]|nr:polysaccharide deacetylase family protein [Treponema sp.]
MKKYLFSFFTLILFSLPVFAKITFGNIDVNPNDEVLFTISQEMAGTSNYKSLVTAKLKNDSTEKMPEFISYFPEQMELINGKKILEVRNRYGKALYDIESASFKWEREISSIPEKPLPIVPYALSADGQWLCKIQKTGLSTGMLVLQNVQNGFSEILCDEVRMSYEKVPVKWAKDSSMLLYEKKGTVYFCNPDAVLRGVEIDEKYRKIGRGTINSVEFTSSKYLAYIDDYLLYKINTRELYTLGLYAGIIGNGNVIGRLPFQFDPENDKFSTNDDVSSIFVIQNKRMFTFLSSHKDSCDYMDVNYSRPYTDSNASLVESYVFWDKSGYPNLWMEKLPYDGKEIRSSVFKISSVAAQVLEIEDSGKPFLSPDGTKVAFYSGAALYVYDIQTWHRIADLGGEKIVSALWYDNKTVFVGGERSIRKWNPLTGQTDYLAISSAVAAYWDGSDNKIIADNGSGNCFEYNKEKGTWKKSGLFAKREGKTQNGHYRVFTGTTPNARYENSIYVRSLSKKPVTKPIYPESVIKSEAPKKVSIIFDAYDNADGLADILTVLKKYNIKGTFFMNGEFIRRYPSETQQIVANGYSCGSMFFSTTDLKNNDFIIDEDFIRRGLARNEDEFYTCTQGELSLYWHSPYYSVLPKILTAGENSGYTYVNPNVIHCDTVKTFKNISPDQLLKEYLSKVQADKGGVLPVCVGYSQGNRAEPLYNYLDLLICGLIESDFEIVPLESNL